ncbi:hypothetical protein [Chlamydiifrater volucris]|uniref:hypothetical protein n=1 Tax=Chlamydiifrater volucris TaxID=2681470 RepID=UPI0032B26D51
MSLVQGMAALSGEVLSSLNTSEKTLLDRVEKLEKGGRKTLVIVALLTINFAVLVANSATLVLSVPTFLGFALNLTLVVLCAYFLIKMVLKKKLIGSKPGQLAGVFTKIVGFVGPFFKGSKSESVSQIVETIIDHVKPLWEEEKNETLEESKAEEGERSQKVSEEGETKSVNDDKASQSSKDQEEAT